MTRRLHAHKDMTSVVYAKQACLALSSVILCAHAIFEEILLELQVATALLVAGHSLLRPFGYLRFHPPARTQASFKALGCSCIHTI